jgi:hypothetical protein
MRCWVGIVSATVLIGSTIAGYEKAKAQSIQAVPRPGATNPSPGQPAAPAVAVSANPTVVKSEATRTGRTDTDIFLGVYLTLDRDCKVGPSPRFEFVTNPKHGKFRTRNHPINLRDVPGAPRRTCIGTSPNGQALIYRSDRRFKGEEKVEFRVIYPNGDQRDVIATVTVE